MRDTLNGAAFYQAEGNRKLAAFTLHQTVKAAYICTLLVHTFYFPRSHNIKFLRSLAEDVDNSLVVAWPRDTKLERRRFETLKRTYVEARYSDQDDVSEDNLRTLQQAAQHLSGPVTASAERRIDGLRSPAHE